MSVIDVPKLLTTQDLLAMPDDGTDRELSRGKLREQGVSLRDRRHARTIAK